MKITFYSNFLNHYQAALCQEFYKLLKDEFKFVATEKIPEERLKLGFKDLSQVYPFSINTYSNEKDHQLAMDLALQSDVVVIGLGDVPKSIYIERIKQNKITFYYSERLLKKGFYQLFHPRRLLELLSNHTINRKKNMFMLCSSAYTPLDFSYVGAYKKKTYKWGYFSEVIQYDIDQLMLKKKASSKIKLLWAGRFLDWKHPDDVIKVVKKLHDEGYDFELNMIGVGDTFDDCRNLVKTYQLEEKVRLLGSMSPENVRTYMEESHIYMFTSDRGEGWGVVLNESMNSGCAVIASHAAGSVPYMIENLENGVVYRSQDVQDLYAKTKYLFDYKEEIEVLGRKAYETVRDTWSPKHAAEMFIELSKSLIHKEKSNIEYGPCSPAPIIKDKFSSK